MFSHFDKGVPGSIFLKKEAAEDEGRMFASRSQETLWEGGMFRSGKRRMEQTFMGPRPRPEGKGTVSVTVEHHAAAGEPLGKTDLFKAKL